MSKKSAQQEPVVPPKDDVPPEKSCRICKSPDNSRMVACDECGQWYHFECVGVNQSVQDRDWSCDKCKAVKAQIPAGFSTPVAGARAAREQRMHRTEHDDQLVEQIELLRRRLNEQQLAFDTVLQQRDKLEMELNSKDAQTRNNSVQVSGRLTGAIPKACSTMAPEQSENALEKELKLLEEKQSLEKRHIEERLALLRRRNEAAPTTAATCKPTQNVAEFRTIQNWNETDFNNFLSSSSANELSRSQLAARQAVARDLPVFSGNPEEWPLFIASFESSTRMCGYSDEENLLRLQRCLRGKALDAVRYRLLHPSNLAGVIITLRTLFGRPEIIVHSLVSKIRDMPPPKAEKLNTLIEFGVAVQNVCATIKACGLDEYLCNVALLQELVDRLPPSIKLNWAMHRLTLASITLSSFGDWLGQLVEAACAVTVTPTYSSSNAERRLRKENNFINVHIEELENTTDSREIKTTTHQTYARKCPACKGVCKTLADCRRFQAMSITNRWSIIKDNRLCRKCLRKHFGACEVRTPCGRNGCNFMHNAMLHDDARYTQYGANIDTNNQNTIESCNTHLESTGKILFKYIPVMIHGRNKTVETYAFLDDGSSSTLMEHSLIEELQLEGSPHPLCLNWTAGQHRFEKESLQVSLKISGVNNQNRKFTLPEVHTVRSLSLPPQSLVMPELVAKYNYLDGLPIASYKDVSPRILIGINDCHLGHSMNSREGKANQPVAAKTRLGWLVYGPCALNSGSSNAHYTAYHGVQVCQCCRESDKNLNEELKMYFSIDSLGISKCNNPILSKDNERALQLLSSQTQLKDNRYETGLLWRYDDATLPNNKAMALKRLICLEKRMNNDNQLAEIMKSKIKDYEIKGYIRKLNSTELTIDHPRTWYLPIFPVVNPNKPGKVRIVWDAAAFYRGVSLNSLLLTGPDQLNSLLSVLYRFREFRIALTGDIREMFHQVLINEKDQHSQRFLWRDGDSTRSPDEFVMRVMTFGATCSPSSAQFVKNVNAEKFQLRYPRAVECILKEHYVDDLSTSVESEEEAITLAREVRFIHSQAGFEIRNWLSNSNQVLAAIGDVHADEKNMNIYSEMATEKILGMYWCTRTDIFTFRLSARHDKELLSGCRIPTKREVLKTLMTIYDPIGIIANFLMFLKILLQEIWRSGTGWDDIIKPDLNEKWRTWLRILPMVETVRVPRCYRQITTMKNTIIQLHVYVDASENGVAAVAYFRFEQNGIIECALVGSKTRVAPLKYLSIPRLELQAAVVGARLATSIIEAHKMEISEKFFWTDSRDVICWLRSDHRRYSQFVAVRISELLESTAVNNWKWLSTKLNVADEGTKWQKLPEFSSSNRWFRGPEFLWLSESEWPQEKGDAGSTTTELRSSILHHTINEPLLDPHDFSTWKRLLRVVAYVIRFAANIHLKIKGQLITVGPLTQKEYCAAERFLYRQLQQQTYPEEVKLLSDSKRPLLPKASSLYKLSPVVDEYGVLRMRGRIDACEYVPDSCKQPILLPKRDHVTDLVIAEYHQKYKHINHETAMNEIKQKYYIPKLRSAYQRVRRNCQLCKIRRANPQPPIMGNLPVARLAAFTRPFSYTGIDYFGPIQVVVGRRVEKRWGVLLTCMTIRAIHIEIAHSLTTDSCILALRNFIARRGSPIEIISDRGTNFIGASRELREAMKQLSQEKMMKYFESPDTKWTFNPPASPHFGGCWERLIQSVKKVMNRIKLSRHPTDEILQNMMLEIEMMINSRPLTHVPLDDESCFPLTPNHFLLGSSSGSKPLTVFDDNPSVLKQSWKMSQIYANEFWKKWVAEYLPTLTRRTKWFQPTKPIEKGDIVLIADSNLPRNCWPKGRVVDVVLSRDGQVRQAAVQTSHGILERPAVKIAVLDVGSNNSKSN